MPNLSEALAQEIQHVYWPDSPTGYRWTRESLLNVYRNIPDQLCTTLALEMSKFEDLMGTRTHPAPLGDPALYKNLLEATREREKLDLQIAKHLFDNSISYRLFAIDFQGKGYYCLIDVAPFLYRYDKGGDGKEDVKRIQLYPTRDALSLPQVLEYYKKYEPEVTQAFEVTIGFYPQLSPLEGEGEQYVPFIHEGKIIKKPAFSQRFVIEDVVEDRPSVFLFEDDQDELRTEDPMHRPSRYQSEHLTEEIVLLIMTHLKRKILRGSPILYPQEKSHGTQTE